MKPYAPSDMTRLIELRLLCVVLAASLLVVAAIAQPVNDNYANFSVFDSATNSVTGTIVGATREPGEYPSFGRSVWWRWVAPSNGTFTFVAEADRFRPLLRAAPTGTNLLVGLTNVPFIGIQAPNRFATEFPLQVSLGTEYTIALFTGSNSPTGDYTLRVVASAPPTASFVQPSAYRTRHIIGTPLELQADASDPDGQVVRVDFFVGATLLGSTSSPPYHIWASTDAAIPDRDSRLFIVAENNAGLFGVGGWDPTQNRLIAFRRPPPPNDMFDARVALSGDAVRVEANNGGASIEPGEPPAPGEQTLWWSWTAPASSNYCVLARGLISSPSLSIFTGDALSTLNLVGTDGNICGNLTTVVLQAQAGQQYALAVGDNCGTLGGPFTLHILPTTAAPQIVDIRMRRRGEVANVPALELLAVGMGTVGWTVECSTNLQQWQPCEQNFPYGWVDGNSNWADTFHARFDLSPGSTSFYRLRRIP